MNEISYSTRTESPFEMWFEVRQALSGKSLMEHLFSRMDGLYPQKWRSNFPTVEAIDNWQVSWAEAFHEEGIKPQDIKAGLKACRTKFSWPPSCAEFITACKPSIDPLVAYYEAVAGIAARKRGEIGVWSSKAVYWAAIPLAFDLSSLTYSQMKPRWEAALAEQQRRGEWDEIPIPLVAIAAPGKGELSREKAAEMIKKIGASDVLKPKNDEKRWAKRILEGCKKSGHHYSSLQIRFANEAMDAKLA